VTSILPFSADKPSHNVIEDNAPQDEGCIYGIPPRIKDKRGNNEPGLGSDGKPMSVQNEIDGDGSRKK
jgi:hypothetical protein